MKKLAYSIAVLLAACACTKDFAPKTTSPFGKMTFSATFEGSDTKTSLGDGNTVIWDSDDAISVFDLNTTATNAKCTLSSGAGTTSGIFTGDAEKSTTGYFALYPYNGSASYGTSAAHSEGILTLLRMNYSTQYARKGNIPSNIPMVAYAAAPSDGSSKVSLNFKNVFSYLKFTTEYRCKSVTISSNSDDALTPSDYTLYFENGVPAVSSLVAPATRTVTLQNEDGSPLEPGIYYAAVLPQTLSGGFKMTFTASYDDNKTIVMSTEKSIEFKRGTIHNLGRINLIDLMGLSGSGTEDDPYLIRDYTDLETMSSLVYMDKDNYASAYYRQECDIDCENKCLTPIGCKTRFSGHYDGKDNTISNLKVGETNFDDLISFGLFGCIKNAEIKNLNILNPTFAQLSAASSFNISPLVGVAISDSGKNVIQNCHIIGDSGKTVEISNSHYLDYGGIVAFNESELEIKNCSTSLNVNIDASSQDTDNHLYVGGIVGYTSGEKTSDPTHDKAANNAMTVITYCRNSGDIKVNHIKSKQTAVGGIVGKCYDSYSGDVCTRIGGCVSSGWVQLYDITTGDNDNPFLGGIVGCMDSDGYMSGISEVNPMLSCCLVSGTLAANALNVITGGIIGWLYDEDTELTYCVNAATNNTIAKDDYGYDCKGGESICHLNAEHPASISLKAEGCYATNEWFIEEYSTYKPDLTADDMNKLTSGKATWTGKAADHSLDIVF